MECAGVEPDGDDVGDSLRGRYFADDHVRATWRHESANLRNNQLRHLGFPTEAEPFALTAGSRHSGRRLE